MSPSSTTRKDSAIRRRDVPNSNRKRDSTIRKRDSYRRRDSTIIRKRDSPAPAFSTRFQNKLESSVHKGDNGVILVIGGSEIYTGAPYFSAMAALRSGADLVFIMAPPSAIPHLKMFYEAIVLPIQLDERILNKVTACVFGPGLGRVEISEHIKILRYLNERKVPIVIDADGIHYYKEGKLNFILNGIITPNYKERIGIRYQENHYVVEKGEIDEVFRMKVNEGKGNEKVSRGKGDSESNEGKVSGESDTVSNEEKMSRESDTRSNEDSDAATKDKEKHGKKRCGGQGDILTGVIATIVSVMPDEILESLNLACRIVRMASFEGFQKCGYGLITREILDEIPGVLKRKVMYDDVKCKVESDV